MGVDTGEIEEICYSRRFRFVEKVCASKKEVTMPITMKVGVDDYISKDKNRLFNANNNRNLGFGWKQFLNHDHKLVKDVDKLILNVELDIVKARV